MPGDASRLNGKKGGRPRKNGATATRTRRSAPAAAKSVESKGNPPETPIENPHKLDPKELQFVECYTGVSRFNASDAYLRAGYKGKPGKVSGLAARLIARDRVSQAVAERLGSRLRTLQMDGDEALEGISRIGRSDIRKVFDERGNVRPIVDLDDDTADAIASVKVVERRVPIGNGQFETEYVKEFKLYDKLKARETMAKAAGKLVERHEHVGPVQIVVSDADARL